MSRNEKNQGGESSFNSSEPNPLTSPSITNELTNSDKRTHDTGKLGGQKSVVTPKPQQYHERSSVGVKANVDVSNSVKSKSNLDDVRQDDMKHSEQAQSSASGGPSNPMPQLPTINYHTDDDKGAWQQQPSSLSSKKLRNARDASSLNTKVHAPRNNHDSRTATGDPNTDTGNSNGSSINNVSRPTGNKRFNRVESGKNQAPLVFTDQSQNGPSLRHKNPSDIIQQHSDMSFGRSSSVVNSPISASISAMPSPSSKALNRYLTLDETRSDDPNRSFSRPFSTIEHSSTLPDSSLSHVPLHLSDDASNPSTLCNSNAASSRRSFVHTQPNLPHYAEPAFPPNKGHRDRPDTIAATSTSTHNRSFDPERGEPNRQRGAYDARNSRANIARAGSAVSITTTGSKPPPPNSIPNGQGPPKLTTYREEGRCGRVWEVVVACFTFCVPNCLLKVAGLKDVRSRQAWREKVMLCLIVLMMCAALGFFTFAYLNLSCRAERKYSWTVVQGWKTQPSLQGRVVVHGSLLDLNANNFWAGSHAQFITTAGLPSSDSASSKAQLTALSSRDASIMFPVDVSTGVCATLALLQGTSTPAGKCSFSITASSADSYSYCHSNPATIKPLLSSLFVGYAYYEWKDVESSNSLFVYNGHVLDISQYLAANVSSSSASWLGARVDAVVQKALGTDATLLFENSGMQNVAQCLVSLYLVGELESETILCYTAQVVQTMALIIIISLVMSKFLLAVVFGWFLSRQLGRISRSRELRQGDVAGTGVTAATHPQTFSFLHSCNFDHRYRELFTLILVTCYSEGESGLRTTLDSLAQTTYHAGYKLLVIVADGVVTGSGNAKATGDIAIDLLDLDETCHGKKEADPVTGQIRCRNAEPKSYLALGDGSKRHNRARVYCGTYSSAGKKIACILIYKCGTESEQNSPKPGNRGKRDSQIILMDFASKVTFDDRQSPLQFDMFTKFTHIMTAFNGEACAAVPSPQKQSQRPLRITPDVFEIVLMVDADTRVMPDSLTRMVAVMQLDPNVMGLCGETRIMNKHESWVTLIQVFEYYISHHLNKAFESMFGGVTCLPGCFCMYRIKAPKPTPETLGRESIRDDQVFWIPILSNPDIVAEYSETVVETLHRKNLLLLGEDRYLSTLMLRTFPKRKMMFVPKALCKTTVPATLQVLMSQRRRWINSTVHNLMELVLVKDLCGLFCCSMQFVVFLELIGTVTLPAAIAFTMLLIVTSFISAPQWVPLALLGAILGLPAVLILLTTRKFIYVYFMCIYLLSLPVWNFLLPVYAFWHFDDFSWGQTRQVLNEKAGGDGGHGGGETQGSDDISKMMTWKRWQDWERERLRDLKDAGVEDFVGRDLTRHPQPHKVSLALTSRSVVSISRAVTSAQPAMGSSKFDTARQ